MVERQRNMPRLLQPAVPFAFARRHFRPFIMSLELRPREGVKDSRYWSAQNTYL